ncbi:MAG: peptidoglycan DD-metalloendopeptidase family protein [Anaerolineaceae bacterium]|nr:peptidoglycan DD-metalloendopeptidase family protein [Anaerolineaceae bacterium]
MKTKISLVLIAFLLSGVAFPVSAQTPELPVYIVQPGDTLYTIADQFDLTIDEILEVNSLANPDWLSEGDMIRIPGFEGISGEFIPYTISLADTFSNLLEKASIDKTYFIKINHITSPNELIAGKDIILPIRDAQQNPSENIALENFSSPFLQLSIENTSIWENDFSQITAKVINKDHIEIQDLSINPFPFEQGKTNYIYFEAVPDQTLQFLIDNKRIPVFQYESGKYLAMYGINALSDTGLRELLLQSLSDDRNQVLYSQNILTGDSAFTTDPVIVVEPDYIDPEKTMPEEEQLFAIANNVSDRDLWDGSFSYPVDEPCIRSRYGSIRSYNHGPYDAFHTGVDFGICAANLNIYASGAGRVVHAGEWFVRGNSVVIDHGWGIFTGYWHMQTIDVQVGDIVEEGQIIGIIGTTGRSTGSHLHWELMLNDVQVDPLQWIETSIP